jgi:uncharacterized protein (TIGR02246 family)
MKIRLAVALVGLTIGLAVPTFAQQKDTVDPKTAQQIRALAIKFDEAFNRSDSVALAALYTEDAVHGTLHDGTFHGRQAIEKSYENRFQRWHPKNYVSTVDRLNAVGNEIRSIGRWNEVFQDVDAHVKNDEGYYSSVLVRDGDTWKISRDTASESNRRAN